MVHTAQALLSTITAGVMAHLDQWIGWATLIAAGLFGFRAASPWMPLLVAVIINPTVFGLVGSIVHGHGASLDGVATYTTVQLLIAYAGYLVGRLITRFR